jgi:hypothetical protein
MQPRVQGPDKTTSPMDAARAVEIAARETMSAIRARALAHLRDVRSEERRANIIALRCSCRGESTGCAQTPDSPPTQAFPNFGEDEGWAHRTAWGGISPCEASILSGTPPTYTKHAR